MGGNVASLRASPRRARATHTHASLTQLHAGQTQLTGLADQHQSAARVGGVPPELARQPAVRQDSRDEDQGRPASSQAQQGQAQGTRRQHTQGEHPIHREPNKSLLAASSSCQQ